MAEGCDRRGRANRKPQTAFHGPRFSHALALKSTVQIRPQLLAHAGQGLARPAQGGSAKFMKNVFCVDAQLPDHRQGSLQPNPYLFQRLQNTPFGGGR